MANGVGYALEELQQSSVTYPGTIAGIDVEVDGADYTISPGDTGWGNNGGTCIGARWHTGSGNFYAFQGKIFCIRYYNRVLTEEERQHNRLVDALRFGFTL